MPEVEIDDDADRPIGCGGCLRAEVPTALTTYRPLCRLHRSTRSSAWAARFCARSIEPVSTGASGVVFSRIRLHRGQLVSYAIDARGLSAADQQLILSNELRRRLAAVLQERVAITRAEQAILIVIDLRPTRRERLNRWWRRWRHTHFKRSGQQ